MQIFRSLNAYTADADLLLTIGVFDGVHIGHRAVLDKLRARRAPGLMVGALTFESHPLTYLQPGHAPRALTTVAEKINLLDECGLDVLLLLPFDQRIQSLSAGAFLEDVLLRTLRTRLLVVGGNWRFGKERTGDVALAQRVLASSGCELEIESLLMHDDRRVSSSRIRELIDERRFDEADELLGSPFTLHGIVRGGEGRGHRLGFPTANLDLPTEKLVPPAGVFATTARHDGVDYGSVVSIGDKPTFGGQETVVEVHLLDFDKSIYGEQVAVRGWRFLREQRRFENAEALVAQMKKDVAAARS